MTTLGNYPFYSTVIMAVRTTTIFLGGTISSTPQPHIQPHLIQFL